MIKEVIFGVISIILAMFLIAMTITASNEGFAGCRTIMVQPVGVGEALTLQRCYGKLSIVKEPVDFKKFMDSVSGGQ